MIKKPICDYCGKPAKIVNGSIIYPHRPDLKTKNYLHCEPCKAYVGIHDTTGIPFGRLANEELRKLKQKAHKTFDTIWQEGYMGKKNSYKWLAIQLGLSEETCQIGMLNEDQCRQVIQIVFDYLHSD